MERFEQDGVIYEALGDGTVRVVGYADQSQGMITKPADPARQYKAPQAEIDLQLARQRAAEAAATAPFAAATAAAQARKAQADATKAERDVAAQQATANPEQQQAMAALANDEILSAIAKARSDLTRTGAAGFAARLPELLQPQSAVDLSGSLNTIASRLTLDKLAQLKQASPTGASGLGSLTEREGALLRDSVAGLGQTQSPERLLENLAAVEKHYRNFRALTAGEDYRDPKVAERYGIAPPPEPQRMRMERGSTRVENDPALRGVNSRIRQMIGAGKSAGDIVAYMNSVQPGLGDGKADAVRAAVTYRGQNPTVPLSKYPIEVEQREVPMSTTRQFVNRVAQTPGGAFLMGAGDAVTFGTLDNMQDNSAVARAGMSAVGAENPYSTLAGNVVGSAVMAGGAEAAAFRLGAGRFAPMAADAAYGGLYGAGSSDEGSRLGGAATGAASGVGGGMLGRTTARALGATLTGVRDPAVQYLRERGVPLTFGQAVSRSGRMGARIARREDRLAGFSGVGDQIGARRREGLEAFGRAAYVEGLAPIGGQAINATGEEAVEQASDFVGAAYRNALDPVRLSIDPQFAADMAPVARRATALPGEMAENARYTLNERVGASLAPGGDIVAPGGALTLQRGAELTGRNFQQAIRGLEGDARGVRNAPYGNDFGNVARDARGAMENMLERQSPGTLNDYLNANAAYRNTSILADATAAAMNSDGVFTPAQLGQAARANARKFTGRISAATTDRPFYELQRAGQRVLPNKVPDSGTAGRVDAGGEGITAMARRAFRNVRNAPLYAESTQPLLGAVLLDRPDLAVRIGEHVYRRAGVGGMLGRPLALTEGPFSVRGY